MIRFRRAVSRTRQASVRRTGSAALFLGIAGCCLWSTFNRDVVVSHSSGREVGPAAESMARSRHIGPNGNPLPTFALRLGDIATFRGQAEETYVGDSGCESDGLLGPSSAADPDGYAWSGENPTHLSVLPFGLVRGLAIGESVLRVDRLDPPATGRAVLRILPWFDSVAVEATRDTVAVGDTVSVLVTALSETAPVDGIHFRSAGLGVSADPGTALVNSIFSELDASPVRIVMTAPNAWAGGAPRSHPSGVVRHCAWDRLAYCDPCIAVGDELDLIWLGPTVRDVHLAVQVLELPSHEAPGILNRLVVHLRPDGPKEILEDLLGSESTEVFFEFRQEEAL